MSEYNHQRSNTAGRAPFPAHNRQYPIENGGNKLYCYGCNQTKTRLAFSETQLKKTTIRNQNKKHQPMCKSCTPTQSTTLKCIRCSKVQSMESFSKTQRKLQEKATCMACRKYIEDNDSAEDYEIADDPDWFVGDIRDVL
ncbi:hypothetical protein BG011_008618 [Mortierella polycephala]|uniref:Stc1 domain-containing protein n=1 Tax=Mortierella polycephala TaxID=41804 RepID=A0A9P6QCD5_9FUNG|nr:hypothetical protein BG011_008618 [Mortierella polycephala]